MKRIVIVGNSAAGISAVETIRENDKESSVRIVSAEPYLAYHRHKILDYLEGKIKERDLFYRDNDFYKNHAVELLLEKEAVELNLNKKKLIFKDREFVEFDELLIAAGRRVTLPNMKGIQKEGVVAINGLKDVKFIIDSLPIVHTAIVAGGDGVAEEVARIIAAKSIEVKYFGNLSSPIEGIEAIADNPISEILGDSEVKAVRLASSKVIGASIVIFSGPREARLDFLKDTDIKVNKGILVDADMRASVPFVFAAGDVAEFSDKQKSYGWETAVDEGRIAGGALCRT